MKKVTTSRWMLSLAIIAAGTSAARADFSFPSFSLGSNVEVRGFAEIQNTGVVRLTPMDVSQYGEVWYPTKQLVAQGFDTSFAIKMHRPDDDYYYGTDGIVFMIQNSDDGTDAIPTTSANGLLSKSLNIKFDSWWNGPSDVSASAVQVRNGSTILATVDLSKIAGVTLDSPPPEGPPGGGPPQGFPIPTLTVRSSSAAYPVRVTYGQGRLNVYFQGVKVIDSLAVDLTAAAGLGSDGMAYLGFGATTAAYKNPTGSITPRVFADQSQFNDLQSWSFASGAPQAEATPLTLASHAFDLGASTLSLTWNSSPGKTYRVTTSEDLLSWVTVQGATSIATQGATTTTTIGISTGAKGFFRVEEN